jgi:hypothetical protein
MSSALAAARRGAVGVAVDESRGPAPGEVFGREGALGEGQREEVVELVDEAGALAGGGLEACGGVAQRAEGVGQGLGRGGPLGDGEAGGGAGLDGVGLLAAAEGGAVVLVALGVAARHGDRGVRDGTGVRVGLIGELVEEVEEVISVLAGGVEADGEGGAGVAPGDKI